MGETSEPQPEVRSADEREFTQGEKVTLDFGPYKGIQGTIIDIDKIFHPVWTGGGLNDPETHMYTCRYKVQWDDPQHGTSGWLTVRDLKSVEESK